MKDLKFISVQPRNFYYAWQVEVVINNFTKNGINPNNIEILVSYSSNPNDGTNSKLAVDAFNKLAEKYNSVRFFFYEDTRTSKHYVSSIRPNALKQHFQQFPELSKAAIFYHDCDIVFTQKPNFTPFLNDDKWYLSDTTSYINYDYIISKGEDVFLKMCNIVDIDPNIPQLNNSSSGGAQYIMKNVNYEYWDKVEKDAEKLYKDITDLNIAKVAENSLYHPLQI